MQPWFLVATLIVRLHLTCVDSEQRLRRHGGPRIDASWGDYVVDVKQGTAALRQLHTALVQLAVYLDAEPEMRGILLLVDPRISESRLRQESKGALGILRGDMRERIDVVVMRGDVFYGLPVDARAGLRGWLTMTADRESARRPGVRLKRPSAESQVLELLVHNWMWRAGPVTTRSLEAASGFSYPSVAAALKRLKPMLRRTSDRRVELSRFPREAWARHVAGAEDARSTLSFVDRSGQPRSPASLLGRLRRMTRTDVAVGGTDGARYFVPDLDVVGSPWLSLSQHCPRKRADVEFVRRLDPALSLRRAGAVEPPVLVVHCVQRPEPVFHRGPDDTWWADPVACLLDLHEMRLEAQASAFIAHFATKRADQSSEGRR